MKRVGSQIPGFALYAAVAGTILALGSGNGWAQDQRAEVVENARPQLLEVEVSFYGFYFLDGVEVTERELSERLRTAGASDQKPEVVLSVDVQRHWQEAGKIAGMMQEFGLTRARLKVELPDMPPPPPAVQHEQPKPIGLMVTVDGQFKLDGKVMAREDLQAELAAIASMDPQPEVHIDNEAGAKFGEIAFAMAAAQRAGIRRLGVIGGT